MVVTNYIDNNGILHQVVDFPGRYTAQNNFAFSAGQETLGNRQIRVVRMDLTAKLRKETFALTEDNFLLEVKEQDNNPVVLPNMGDVKDFLVVRNVIVLLSESGQIVLYNRNTTAVTQLEQLTQFNIQSIGLCDVDVPQYQPGGNHFSFYTLLDNGNVVVTTVDSATLQFQMYQYYSGGDAKQFAILYATSYGNANLDIRIVVLTNNDELVYLNFSPAADYQRGPQQRRVVATGIKQFTIVSNIVFALTYDGVVTSVIDTLPNANQGYYAPTATKVAENVKSVSTDFPLTSVTYITNDDVLIIYNTQGAYIPLVEAGYNVMSMQGPPATLNPNRFLNTKNSRR